MKTRLLLSAAASLALSIAAGHAQIIPIALSGNSDYDGWGNWATIPGSYGNFPGLGSWAAPLGSNLMGSGDAVITKTNATFGGPYKASGSLYFGSTANVQNALGGTVTFTDPTPVASLKTVVFQLEYGEANGYDFLNNDKDLKITLQTNQGQIVLSSDYYVQISRIYTGTFPDPDTGEELPLYTNTYAYQWDFSDLYETFGGFAISSYGITFSGVQHSQIYAVQLNQSDTFTQVVPEPSTYALMALGLGLVAWKARRSAVKSV